MELCREIRSTEPSMTAGVLERFKGSILSNE
jgi:hypothetical protein